MNQFPGYHQMTVASETQSSVLYSYVPEKCVIGSGAVLDSKQEPAAFFEENGWTAIADEKGIGIFAFAAPQDGWNVEDVSLVTAASGLMSPSAEVYNYFSIPHCMLIGYGDGAAQAMYYVEKAENKAPFASVILEEPVGYTFHKECANTAYAHPYTI